MKTITICGSMKFFAEIEQLKKDVEDVGFEVLTPKEEKTATDYTQLSKQEQADIKQWFIDRHIEKIKKSDAILIANYTKNGAKDRIGENSFLEMGFAYILKKQIFILHNIPEQPNTIEIEGLKPIVLQGNLQLLKKYK